jgi:transcriptional regulator with XRE-family HTH domain
VTDGDVPRSVAPLGDYSALPGVHITPNQLNAFNLAYFRKAAGMTQAELGERAGLSFRAVSAAERTWDRTDGKGRVFDANLVTVLARALDIPIAAFFLPPPDDGISKRYLIHAPAEDGGEDCLTMHDLTWLALSDPSEDDTPVMRAYQTRYQTAINTYVGPEVAEELAARRGDLTAAEFRARLIERLQAQRAVLAEVIGDIDRQVDAIVDSGSAR